VNENFGQKKHWTEKIVNKRSGTIAWHRCPKGSGKSCCVKESRRLEGKVSKLGGKGRIDPTPKTYRSVGPSNTFRTDESKRCALESVSWLEQDDGSA
jgi:hypothetical protein